MSTMKIGTAKYGYTQKKYFKLKEGESKFRILPPLGDLADAGVWSMFYRIHYGYKNSQGKLRVFQSSLVKNGKTKMIEVPDAAVERLETLKAQYEQAKAAGNKPVADRLGKLVSGQKPMYNLDSNHYMNAIDEQGNIGVLKLRHKAKQALDVEIKKLREKGIDPLSVDNGRFFTITRTGMGLDTTFKVDVTQETLMVQGVGEVKRDMVHKLSDELIGRLSAEASQLGKLFKKVTAEEIEQIVKSSDLLTGNSPAIDTIIDAKSSDGGEGAAGDSGDEEPESSGVATSGTQASAVAQVANETLVKAQQQAQDIAKVATENLAVAQQVSQQAVQTPVQEQVQQQAQAVVKNNPVQTTSEVVSDMSDADFLKSLGLG